MSSLVRAIEEARFDAHPQGRDSGCTHCRLVWGFKGLEWSSIVRRWIGFEIPKMLGERRRQFQQRWSGDRNHLASEFQRNGIFGQDVRQPKRHRPVLVQYWNYRFDVHVKGDDTVARIIVCSNSTCTGESRMSMPSFVKHDVRQHHEHSHRLPTKTATTGNDPRTE